MKRPLEPTDSTPSQSGVLPVNSNRMEDNLMPATMNGITHYSATELKADARRILKDFRKEEEKPRAQLISYGIAVGEQICTHLEVVIDPLDGSSLQTRTSAI